MKIKKTIICTPIKTGISLWLIISIICVILLNLCNLCFSQNTEFKKSNFPDRKEAFKIALKEYRTGDFLYSQQKYAEALEHLLEAYEFNPQHAKLNYKIGKCYFNSPYKTQSLLYFEKAEKIDPEVDLEIHYSLGYAFHLNSKWDEAISEYMKFSETLPENAAEMKENVMKKIEECQSGKELEKTPLNVRIDNLGEIINTEYKEYGPTISADESVLMFTSRREETTGGVFDSYLNEYFEDIYISYNKDGRWTKPENAGEPVNTERHDAIVGLSFDGQKLFIYRDDEKGNGDIFESTLKGDKWSEPKKLDEPINSEYHESSACLAFDGTTLYFVSNRPGSIGNWDEKYIREQKNGRDIYMSQWDKKRKVWKKPKNLGKTINTKYNEETVYIHPDGNTLYFCSQGHNSMGGYDIFKSTAKGRNWSKPINIGYPINTPDDDVFFVVSASGKHAYYASVQKDGYGKRDLYCISFINPPTEPYQPKLTLLKGIISDAVSNDPVGTNIEIVDNELNQVIADFESNSTTGKYLVSLPAGKNYGIVVKAEGYLFHSENVQIPITYGYQEIERNIALHKLIVGTKIVLNNIFFDHDMATLRPESTSELNRLVNVMKDNPSIKIEISGHTDNTGSDAYNQKLSENRAKAVVDYLIQKSITTERMEYKGYGESVPIATNDTEEGKQLNRRTEFEILSK
ncbi:MAG: OmpA family protein [Bacteroidota bacterium]